MLTIPQALGILAIWCVASIIACAFLCLLFKAAAKNDRVGPLVLTRDMIIDHIESTVSPLSVDVGRGAYCPPADAPAGTSTKNRGGTTQRTASIHSIHDHHSVVSHNSFQRRNDT